MLICMAWHRHLASRTGDSQQLAFGAHTTEFSEHSAGGSTTISSRFIRLQQRQYRGRKRDDLAPGVVTTKHDWHRSSSERSTDATRWQGGKPRDTGTPGPAAGKGLRPGEKKWQLGHAGAGSLGDSEAQTNSPSPIIPNIVCTYDKDGERGGPGEAAARMRMGEQLACMARHGAEEEKRILMARSQRGRSTDKSRGAAAGGAILVDEAVAGGALSQTK